MDKSIVSSFFDSRCTSRHMDRIAFSVAGPMIFYALSGQLPDPSSLVDTATFIRHMTSRY